MRLSNFTPALLGEARDCLDAPFVAHQIEMYPFLRQRELVNHTWQHEYNLVAYSPLVQGAVFDDPVLQDIASVHGVSIAPVALAWLFETENVRAITKASGTTTGLSISTSQQKMSPTLTGSTAISEQPILPTRNGSTGHRRRNSRPRI